MTQTFQTLVSVLEYRAANGCDDHAFTFLADGEREADSWDYGSLAGHSKAIAASLTACGIKPGDRALLLYPPGMEFIAAFFGCLAAGVIAVPAYPPMPAQLARTVPRLLAIAADAQIAVILTADEIARMAPQLVHVAPTLRDVQWIATDRVANDHASDWRYPNITPDTLAFLQYTSGSTSAPKGVMVTHANLLHNLGYLNHLAENDRSSVAVSWLPVIHDMGLIGAVLKPLFVGYHSYLMAPEAFLQRPYRWLHAISRYQATTSGGPNFAYDLCVRKITPQQIDTLDLSSWYCAYNGAEPIRRDTLIRFYEAFRGAGFRWSSLYPVYGLAESTLLVSGPQRIDEPLTCAVDAGVLTQGRFVATPSPDSDRSTAFVACGRTWFDTDVRIVNPESCELCAPDTVGEIWISSPSVARGYWQRDELTVRVFGAQLSNGEGPFLRTGDLGVFHEGQLVVTGRLKDLLIVRGAKHYPQDLEMTAERQHPAIRAGCCAAFATDGAEAESAAMIVEVDTRRMEPHMEPSASTLLPEIAAAIRRGIAMDHGVHLQGIALVPPGTIPKTTSGKLQRYACRAAFESGTLTELHRWSQTSVVVSSSDRTRRHVIGAVAGGEVLGT